jgi:hypothetical protein
MESERSEKLPEHPHVIALLNWLNVRLPTGPIVYRAMIARSNQINRTAVVQAERKTNAD